LEDGRYVAFEGVLDISRRDEVEKVLGSLRDSRSIVINLAHVEHIDSLTLGLLVSRRRAFIESGAHPNNFLLIVRRESGLHRMFQATAFDRIFSIAYVHDHVATARSIRDQPAS
jgi:anti-anti-sigma factor